MATENDKAETRLTGPYALFKTDNNLEREGIWLDYGSFRIRISRAGPSNKRFQKRFEAELKPYRRALQNDMMDDSVAEGIVRDVWADTIVLGWDSKQYGDGKVPGPDGKPMAFSKENVVKLFTDLPDLFADVREQSQKAGLFRAHIEENDQGN